MKVTKLVEEKLPFLKITNLAKIKGNGALTIYLDENFAPIKCFLHVELFRGFEKLLENISVFELPVIASRICGFCSIPHHIASAKAGDNIFDLEIPETAKLLRELLLVCDFIRNHVFHFFYLSIPDFLFQIDADNKNIFGLTYADPRSAKIAMNLRKIAIKIIKRIGGRSIHPFSCVVGGMSRRLTEDARKNFLDLLKKAKQNIEWTVHVSEKFIKCTEKLIASFSVFPTPFLSLTKNNGLNLYDGKLKLLFTDKKTEVFDVQNYTSYISEYPEKWSFMKFPYLRKLGFPVGSYRVGAIARLNVNDKIPTEMASNLFEQLKLQYPPPIYNLLLYHYARIIELVYAYERAIEILEDERVSKSDIRVPFKCHEGEGMAAIEDHTGTLIHHYRCDKKGIIREANIIAGTTHNNFNIEKSIEIALKKYEKIEKITPKILSDIELVLRAYDPCLVCGSH